MIRNDFKMRRQFIDIFDRLETAGLILEWQKNLQIHQKLNIQTSHFRPTNVTDVGCIFTLTIIGMTISGVLIILEILVHHKVNLVNAHRFWIILDKSICGRRCFFLLEPDLNDEITPSILYCP